MTQYKKCHPVRDVEARAAWRASKRSRCQACHGQGDFRNFSVHHIVKFRRSDEPCNLLMVCGDCHDKCEGKIPGRTLTIFMVCTIKQIEDPDEFDLGRLEKLRGCPIELEPLPEWLMILRKKVK